MAIPKPVTAAFTGHRPESLPWKNDESDPRCLALMALMENHVRRLIEQDNVTRFLSGMALGVDVYAAELILKLKSEYPVTLECCLPFEEQASMWSNSQRERYFTTIEKSDKEVLLQYGYTKDAYAKRNAYMVKECDYLIAVSKQKYRSGTESTVSIAKIAGKKIILINPETLDVEFYNK